MGCVKLVLFFMLYPFLCQLAFSSSLRHLCSKDQPHALLQFKQMFTINPNASDYCRRSRTLSWNKSTDCCSWNGVQCDEMTRQAIELDLYCSGLQGKFHTNSNLFQLSNLKQLDLSYTDFFGSLISPKFGELSNLTHLNLSRSSFTGIIPTEISHLSKLQYLQTLILSQNNFSGQIASTIFNPKILRVLDLGSNHLNGTIPHCLGEMSGLEVLGLNNNNLSGTINTENKLIIINLYGNKLKGKVPTSLINCRYLKFLDLGNNELNDTFPSWLGGLLLTTEIIINLSRNRFEGYLPSIIGDLVGLHMLNQSHNGLEGIIPASLEHLSVLESLDLSSNKIGGESPQQLASLIFLAVINLSPNHLVGCIPKGKQFDTFENSSYQGNDRLREFPLSKDCGGDDGVLQATTPVELGCNTPHFGLERKSSFLCVDDPKAINPMQI
ncbi:hypothetical protein T459_03335 [Capsicum annuum]|uniref:Leucine-rich repeat-containing N-terminal plant-type domain-containing protein n=1 Tax=Capsicum annuum TaxID=4072 RepID=A0A2G3AMR9_CAPAN|nr:hypothetical protein T459_03335 [Capsicum annuum]